MTSRRRSILAALAVAIVMLPPTPAASQNRPRTIVALLAHAGDETAAGPALARYAREGVKVYVIIVTDGSGGSGTQTYLQRPDSGPVGDALVRARAAEALEWTTAAGVTDAKATARALMVLFDGALAGSEVDGSQRASDARWMARKLLAA